MTIRHSAITISISILLAVFSHPPASAEPLSAKELKRAQRNADKALAAGRVDQAVELFEKILTSVPAGDSRRGTALYVTTLNSLSSGAGTADAATARANLDELARLPNHPRQLEISTIRGLLAQLDQTQVATDRRTAELEAKLAAAEAQRQEAQESSAGESEAADERVKSLQAQLRRARGELKETKAELEKKDEALQKLKDALVGRAGGSG